MRFMWCEWGCVLLCGCVFVRGLSGMSLNTSNVIATSTHVSHLTYSSSLNTHSCSIFPCTISSVNDVSDFVRHLLLRLTTTPPSHNSPNNFSNSPHLQNSTPPLPCVDFCLSVHPSLRPSHVHKYARTDARIHGWASRHSLICRGKCSWLVWWGDGVIF